MVRPNHSNYWFIHARKIQEMAEERRAELKAEHDRLSCPFEPPHPKIKKSAEVDDDTAEPETADTESLPATDKEIAKDIEDRLREHFSDHPTYAEKNGAKIMRGCIKKCISMAESAARCQSVFEDHLFADEYLMDQVRSKVKLGGYISSSFQTWLNCWEEEMDEEADDETEEDYAADEVDHEEDYRRAELEREHQAQRKELQRLKERQERGRWPSRY